jgi:hypothetical protein
VRGELADQHSKKEMRKLVWWKGHIYTLKARSIRTRPGFSEKPIVCGEKYREFAPPET